MDGLRYPEKSQAKDECPLGEMARQCVLPCCTLFGSYYWLHILSRFWAQGRKTATPMAERLFIETMQLYVDAVVQPVCQKKIIIINYI
jgi:hypothetical protein